MKNFILVGFICALTITNWNLAISQCDTGEEVVENCIKTVPDGFTLVKSYDLNAAKSSSKRIERSFVFTKDMTYTLAFCKEANVGVKVFDSNRNEVTINQLKDQSLSSFGFECGSTGIYYMNFSFDEAADNTESSVVLAVKQ